MFPFRHILTYIDGSESSVVAGMYSILMAKQMDAKLTAVYVVDTKALNELVHVGVFVDVEKDAYQRDLQKDAKRYLKHITQLAAQHQVDVECIEEEGAASVIVKKYVRENDVDVVVTGGLSGIRSRKDDIQSEVDRMVRNLHCPVLVVKDDDKDIWNQFE